MAGAALFGAATFLILEMADAFIATPLRELSSILVQIFLSALGFPITRQGTILATPRMRFDVVPACSGSTTLKVLLFVAIVWAGIQPRLTASRRAVAILLALPAALAANVLRVSVLVFVGDFIGDEPGEFFHVLTGIVAFVLAMGCCLLTTDRLAATSAPSADSPRRGWIALAGLVAFLYAPFLVWCVDNWWGGAPLDRFAWVFAALAGGWTAWRWRTVAADGAREPWGIAGFALSLALLAVATLSDVNLLKGVSLLMSASSLALAHRGPRFLLGLLPVLGIAYLGFPTSSYQIQRVTLALFSSGSPWGVLALKAATAVLLAAATRLPALRSARAEAVPRLGRLLTIEIVLAAACAAFTGYLLATAAGASAPSRLDLSFIQGGWVGRNYRISPEEEDFFKGRIWSRRYVRGASAVDVLVTSTGGDRHRAHPPTYCLTGSGWEPRTSEVLRLALGPAGSLPVTRLRLEKEGHALQFVYWFTDGTEHFANYNDMLVQDMVARARGRRPDWFLFRVMTEEGPPVLNEFLSGFEAVVTATRPP